MTRRLLFFSLLSCAAFAHHLEEVGSYLHVTLSPSGATVEYTAVVSRGVAATQWMEMDADGDGRISAPEEQRYTNLLAPSLADYLTLELAGRAAPFHLVSAALAVPGDATAAARFTLRAVLAAEWGTHPSGRCTGRIKNENFNGYFGNSALWLHAADDVQILAVDKQPLEPLPAAAWRQLFLATTLPIDQRLAEFTAVFPGN